MTFTIIWLVCHGLLAILYAPWLYESFRLWLSVRGSAQYSRHSSTLIRQIVSSGSMMGVSLTYFIVGAISAVNPAASPLLLDAMSVGTLLVNVTAWNYYQTLNRRSGRSYLTENAALAFIMASMMFVIVLWAISNVTPQRFPPPFVYSSDEMPILNIDGTPQESDPPQLCPGDPLVVSISGTTDGRPRTTFIDGVIYDYGFPSRVLVTFPTYSRTAARGVAGFVEFVYDGEVWGRFVPADAPPGLYTYEHGAYEFGSEASGFKAHFEVIDCDQ